ncbi:D-amino acid dehydrogenase, partial [Pelomonas sp. HMWF004]
ILHVYHDRAAFEEAGRVNALLTAGGLERHAVTPDEVRHLEPALQGGCHGGYYTPSDATGDIHKFTRGLAAACVARGVQFIHGVDVTGVTRRDDGVEVACAPVDAPAEAMRLQAAAMVVCAGVGSRAVAAMVGDRVNVYPVKGYSITVHLDDEDSVANAPWVSLLDESAKIVTSRLGRDRFRVAGTAEFDGFNRDIRADRIEPLVRWARRHFRIGTARVTPWAGLRPMMPDMMPRVFRGQHPRVFYNTGHGHLGWTLSAATAQLLAALMAQQFGEVQAY